MKKRLTTVLLSVSVLMLMAFVSNNQEKNESSIGSYSISLNVQDISKSKVFYGKLGFSPVEGMGSVEEKWIILSNGETKIGLFQGMFPSNTITFNPKDGRSIYKKLKKEGIQPAFETNMDKSEGPCTFSIMDPDGNPILIDQH
jgi:catechol 2,3-dioxygenase-like lactoylglutathione lyase family enzyme